MSEKGMITLCETAESESVQLKAQPAVLSDQIAVAMHANRVTSSDASSSGTEIGFPADFDAESQGVPRPRKRGDKETCFAGESDAAGMASRAPSGRHL